MSTETVGLATSATTNSHTVAREMVHRWALSEVFVTGIQTTGQYEFTADAQLPLYHAYYTDHAARPELFDPLLLLECSRQAGTYGTHAVLDVPLGATLVVKSMSIELTDLDALIIGTRPGELRTHVVFTDVQTRGGQVRAFSLDMELTLSGHTVGTAHFDANAVSKNAFRALRVRQRASEPPMSSSLPETPAGVPVSPHLFGRKLQENVVLTNARRDGHRASAQLGVTPRNRSLFDHEYDHYPAMSLFEAARQISLLALDDGTGSAATRLRCTAFSGQFTRFAELDSPITLDVSAPANDALDVQFSQDGAVIAAIAVGFADLSGISRHPGAAA
ncbi:ScbA/BarX family gamma-butyrolactone biosynthesis protein [Saccharopolyspora sp. 5N708]|uniref:ScbA/BarX family gamma-butyrolactone biosynthesis protein n=1 Tax=Saccharopolyspora sp. 5N708 TaxID=3457424 RepID=UPI003FCEF971